MRQVDHVVAALLRRQVRGSHRLARAVYGDRAVRAVPATLNGLTWDADPLDWIDQQIINDGTYEPEITQTLVEDIPDGGCLWDVGANAGVHALSVKAVRPDVEVIAFEPSVSEFLRFTRNTTLNDLDVTAYCVALASARGYRNLSVYEGGNSGLNSLQPWENVPYTRSTPVWCDTADDLIASGVRPPDVMKVDVEGAEAEVLGGMTDLLRAGPEVVVFEASDAASPAASVLVAAGYDIRELIANNWRAQLRR